MDEVSFSEHARQRQREHLERLVNRVPVVGTRQVCLLSEGLEKDSKEDTG